jgi:hypothetical protein
LHRRPDRHPTIVSSLNTFRRDTPGINTQVTALRRGYLRRSEAGVSRTGTHRVKLELHPMTKNPQTGQEEDARVSDHVSDRPR